MPFHAWMSMQSQSRRYILIMHSSQRHNRMIQISLSSIPRPYTSKLCHYQILLIPFYVICPPHHHALTFPSTFVISFLISFITTLTLESVPPNVYLLTDSCGLESIEISVNGPNHAFLASEPKSIVTLSLP